MAVEDAQLISDAVGGDAEAMRSLLERHGPQVWHEIRTNIGKQWQSMVDADDVMQVTYVEAFLHIRNLTAREPAGFVAWLRRIANNNLRDAIKELERKKRPHPAKRVRAPVTEQSYVALIEMLGAESGTPSRHAARNEAGGMIDSVLDQMPPDYARVIRLYDLEGLDIGDVAKDLGRSSGAIHMLRARAHERLRGLLGAETDFFSEA
jgi:RNA polymerase sigma-70 factor (ECF subfamily)